MKKGIKVLLIVLGVIIVLGLIFFAIDYNRVQKQEKPLFCIQHPGGVIMDGGTVEYFGLGYKVIDYNMLNGYDEIKIGSWFMKYEDFENEYNSYVDDTKVLVNGYNNMPNITITGEDALILKQILNEFTYDGELCNGIYSYEITINDEEHYKVKRDCMAIERENKQTEITKSDLEIIENIIENNIDDKKKLEEIPQNYPINQAIKDGCVVISNNSVFNKSKLDSFITNTNANNENRKSDFIRIIKYTIEGAPVITDLEYKAGEGYTLTTDNTRDGYAVDTKVVINDKLPEEFYTIDLIEDNNFINIELALRGAIDYAKDSAEEYKAIVVDSYSKDSITYDIAPSFVGEVTDVNEKVLTVKTEDKNIGDAVWVSVEDTSLYNIGDKIEVLYTGEVLETYPCQIYEIDVTKKE